MQCITVKSNTVAPGYLSADIVDELPEIGSVYHGRTVLEVSPCPPDVPQDDPEVYRYALWKLHLQGHVYWYVAIHEEQAEQI